MSLTRTPSDKNQPVTKGDYKMVAHAFSPDPVLCEQINEEYKKLTSYWLDFRDQVEAKKFEVVFKVLEQLLKHEPTSEDIDKIILLEYKNKSNMLEFCYDNIPLGVLSWGFEDQYPTIRDQPNIMVYQHSKFSINFTPHQ